MPNLDYLNFDLTFERTDDGYVVRVLNSPAGQASEPFVFPFNELEMENFLLRLGQRRSSTRRVDSPEIEASKQFGSKLYDALFDGELRGCLRSSLNEASRQGKGLRLRLRFSEAPELADIPWEFLYDAGVNRFLALSQQTPLVRYLDLPRPARALPTQAPLRILVMISDPSDFDRLDVEREWQRLQDSLADLSEVGMVELTRLDQASLLAVQHILRRGSYHIFHFIGHGDFDARTQQGYLVLETNEGRGQLVSGQDLGFMLHDHPSLRLAVLNACEGGRASQTDPFAGVAQSLIQQGLSAVVAMQFDITDSAAAVFAHEFYLALADGYPVDAALAEARRAIYAVNMGTDWGVPVLFLRAPDGHLFEVQPVAEAQRPRPQPMVSVVDTVAADPDSPLSGSDAVLHDLNANAEQEASSDPSDRTEADSEEKQDGSQMAMLRTIAITILGAFLIIALLFAYLFRSVGPPDPDPSTAVTTPNDPAVTPTDASSAAVTTPTNVAVTPTRADTPAASTALGDGMALHLSLDGADSLAAAPLYLITDADTLADLFVDTERGDGLRFVEGRVLAFENETTTSQPLIDPQRGSLEFWYRPSYDALDHTAYHVFFLAGHADNAPTIFWGKSDSLVFGMRDSHWNEHVASVAASRDLWDVGEWVHLRAVWNVQTDEPIQLYLNGELLPFRSRFRPAVEGTKTMVPFTASDLREIFIGAEDIHGDFSAAGVMDELIFNQP